MWGWLEAIVEAILKVIFGEAEKEITKPTTIEDEQTPEKLKSAVDADVKHKLDELQH
jgi:hypothetical protein